KFFLIQFYNKNVPFCMFFSQKKTADRYFVDNLEPAVKPAHFLLIKPLCLLKVTLQ
ncbi:MAG: hypothetical protein PWQ31_1621, partial [Eubacteriales bacterium]|nr:hypothetical protein [Eubacteriales bacterium]